MIRFFADAEKIGEKEIMLSAEDAQHIRSLRLRPDEQFVVCDGNGTDYICALTPEKPGSSTHGTPGTHNKNSTQTQQTGESAAIIIDKQKSGAEPPVRCTMYIAYAKGDRLDFAVQKSVELGAREIKLFESERCISKPADPRKKIERLSKIATEAAKQSGRGIIPAVTDIGSYRKALDAASKDDLAMLCYEDEKNLHIDTVLEHYFPSEVFLKESRGIIKTVAIITGPEGGFEPWEARLAGTKNISVTSLGPRILRSETAPMVALTAVMYHTGNL